MRDDGKKEYDGERKREKERGRVMDDRKVEREGENCSRMERKFTNWADSDRKNSES